MKKILLLVIIALFAVNLSAQTKKVKSDKTKKENKNKIENIKSETPVEKQALPVSKKFDKNVRPNALSEINFKFPDYKLETLSNGIKVFIVEDHEQPDVSFDFLIGAGSAYDQDKIGAAEFTANILSKGTTTKTALQIAKTLDGVGAGFGLSSSREYTDASGSSLKKHMNLLMDVISDILLNPSFPQEEFDKLIQQKTTELEYQKSEPQTLASNLLRQVIYGKNHPYAKILKEENLSKLTLQDLKDFYTKWYLPNNTTIAVIGDVKPKEVITLLESKLGSWKKAEKALFEVPKPTPQPLGIYFINRPGAVQSNLLISAPIMNYTDRDFETMEVLKNIIGVGTSSRLYQILREKYSFTYGPFGALSRNKVANNFVCGAQVASAKTDSSIMFTLEVLKDLANNPISNEELNRQKLSITGNYYMSFENVNTIASKLQFDDFIGKPLGLIKDYTKRLNAISNQDIKMVAAKYLQPSQCYLIIAGDPSIKADLAKYGTIYDFDLDLNPSSGEDAKYESINLTPEQLLNKYTEAIGGKENLSKISTMISNGDAEINNRGQIIKGKVNSSYKTGNKMYSISDYGMFKQENWCNGTEAWSNAAGTLEKSGPEETKKAVISAMMFADTKLLELGYKCELLGKKNNSIVMKTIDTFGDKVIYYFDANNYLLTKKESIYESPEGTQQISEIYENYKEFGNIKLYTISKTELPNLKIKVTLDYKLNVDISDSEFTPLMDKK